MHEFNYAIDGFIGEYHVKPEFVHVSVKLNLFYENVTSHEFAKQVKEHLQMHCFDEDQDSNTENLIAFWTLNGNNINVFSKNGCFLVSHPLKRQSIHQVYITNGNYKIF